MYYTYKMFRMVPGRCVRVSHQFSHYEKSELEKGGVRLYENNKLYSRSKLQKVHIYIHIMDKKRQDKYTKMWAMIPFEYWVVIIFFVTPWTVACQAPLSMGFPRQEHWSGLPFPPPGDLPHPGIESESPVFLALQADFFLPLSHQKSPSVFVRFSRMSMYDFTITF